MYKHITEIINNWFYNILTALFPVKVYKKPKLIKVFSFLGVDYYTYASLEEMPVMVVSRLFFILNKLYMQYPSHNVIIAGLKSIESCINEQRVSLLKIANHINTLKDYLDWKFNGEALIDALTLLLLPNKRENPSLLKEHFKNKKFKEIIFNHSILLGLNSILLDSNTFFKYLERQAEECERLGLNNEEFKRIAEAINMFINIGGKV